MERRAAGRGQFSLARPLRAEKRACTTDANGERERGRWGNEIRLLLLPAPSLRPNSSFRWMGGWSEDSETGILNEAPHATAKTVNLSILVNSWITS